MCFPKGFPILLANPCFCFKIVSEGILEPNSRQLGSSKVVKSAPRAAKSGLERPKSSQERPNSGQERPKSGQEWPESGQERPKRGPRAAKSCRRAEKTAKSGQEQPTFHALLSVLLVVLVMFLNIL